MMKQRVLHNNRWIERTNRFDCDLMVQAKTLGCNFGCDFRTINISNNGLLVGVSDVVTPYQLNTILDLNIDPHRSKLSRPISCIGKIMRLEENQLNTERKIIQYGITIVQINPSDMILWRELLNQLEREPERQQNLLRIERALETRIRNLPRGSFRAVTGTDKNY